MNIIHNGVREAIEKVISGLDPIRDPMEKVSNGVDGAGKSG